MYIEHGDPNVVGSLFSILVLKCIKSDILSHISETNGLYNGRYHMGD